MTKVSYGRRRLFFSLSTIRVTKELILSAMSMRSDAGLGGQRLRDGYEISTEGDDFRRSSVDVMIDLSFWSLIWRLTIGDG